MKVVNKTYKFRLYPKLSDRECVCKCGETHDRDLNASKNIFKRRFKIYGKGLAITKMESKLDFYKEVYSVKPETHWSLANV